VAADAAASQSSSVSQPLELPPSDGADKSKSKKKRKIQEAPKAEKMVASAFVDGTVSSLSPDLPRLTTRSQRALHPWPDRHGLKVGSP
jgi:hypothetical protein